MQRIADAKPDLLAITGDIFDDVQLNPAAIKLVDSFCDKFKHGIYYIHGNHEHFRGIYQIEQLLKTTKINWLVNRSKNVVSKLYILGVDYPSRAPVTSSSDEAVENRFRAARRSYIEGALLNVPDDAIKILLAHHPEFIDDGAERNCVLTTARNSAFSASRSSRSSNILAASSKSATLSATFIAATALGSLSDSVARPKSLFSLLNPPD